MIMTRETFTPGVIAGMASFGFAPEAPIMYEFPMEMFLTGADLTPLTEGIDYIVSGLTKWEPKIGKGPLSAGEKPTVTGKDYEEAVDNLNYLFLKHMWGDGLPIVPPTEERVNWILTGTDLPRDTIVGEGGQILPKGGIPSVEALAIHLAMAGGRPEYLPLLIATVEAITTPESNLRSWNSTTHSPFPVVIVNGPIGQQLRLTTRYGVLGPDPRFPAGGCIGRAIRLILLILGGAIPGLGRMGIYGHMAYTNAVFAEDEAGLLLLPGWKSVAEERGFAKGANVATVVTVSTAKLCQLHQSFGPSMEEEQIQFLYRIAGDIASPGHFLGYTSYNPDEPAPGAVSGVVLMGYNMPKVLMEFGWTKEKVSDFLRENSVPSWEQLVRTGRVDPAATPEIPVIAPVMLVIAGGDQSNQSLVMQGGTVGQMLVSKEIKLPANWDALLAQSEEDLGPISIV